MELNLDEKGGGSMKLRLSIEQEKENPEGILYYAGRSEVVEVPEWVVKVLSAATHEGTMEFSKDAHGIPEIKLNF